MKNFVFLLVGIYFVVFDQHISWSQSAIMDLESTKQGLLLPRMTQSQRDAIVSPAHALVIYQTNVTPGFYYNQGSPGSPDWQPLSTPPTLPCESRIPIASLPFTISASGSYYVTNHLIGTSDVSGITISTSNVTLDLNGYTLLSGGGTLGSGIIVSATSENIHVYNGNIQGWGDEGISAFNANNSHFENLRLEANQHDGLYVGNNNLIINCQSYSNTIDGIDAGRNCTILNCVAASNGDDGIETDAECSITQSAAFANTDNGLNTGTGNTITSCRAANNSDRGMNVNSGCVLKNNTCSNNTGNGFDIGPACVVEGNTSRINTGNGFDIMQEAMLKNNIADGNSQSGFSSTSSRVRLEQNQSTTNGAHGFDIQGIENCIIIKNSAISNTISNYSIAVGHSAGPIVGPSLSGVTNPFANISL